MIQKLQPNSIVNVCAMQWKRESKDYASQSTTNQSIGRLGLSDADALCEKYE